MSAVGNGLPYREELWATSNEAANVAWQNAEAIGSGPDVGEAVRDLAKTIAAGLNGVRVAILAAIAEPAPAAVACAPPPPLAGWAHVELMGRRVVVGYVREVEIAHRTMLHIQRLVRADRERGLGEPDPPLELESRERLYSPSTLYSIEWITEAEARARWAGMSGATIYDNDDIPF